MSKVTKETVYIPVEITYESPKQRKYALSGLANHAFSSWSSGGYSYEKKKIPSSKIKSQP